MNAEIKQDEINRRVWEACDTFRGTVSPDIYKDYVLTMLFLKYISDVWQDHYDAYKEQHGDHPEEIALGVTGREERAVEQEQQRQPEHPEADDAEAHDRSARDRDLERLVQARARGGRGARRRARSLRRSLAL